MQKTTLLRQLERGYIPADNVIAIARAYGISIVDALVQTEHISEDEVDIVGVTQALGYATNQEMLDEMRKRVDPEAVRLFHGGDGTIAPHFDQSTETTGVKSQEDELASRRGGKGTLGNSSTFTPERSKKDDEVLSADEDDGTVRDWDESLPHAADHTIDEGRAREERGEDPID